MAIVANVRPATTSAPRSPGRQPAKDRKIGQGRAVARKLSLVCCVTSFAPSGAEALSIVLRAHALKPREASPHRLFRAESAARSNPLGVQAGVGEELTRRLDPQPLDGPRGRQ